MVLLAQLGGLVLLLKTKFLKLSPAFTLVYVFLYWASPWWASEQIHNSIMIYAPITLYFWYKREIRVSFRATVLSVFILLIFIAPTIYSLKAHPEILDYNKSGDAFLFKNLTTVAEAIKGMTYWLRCPSLYFGSTTFQLPKIEWADRTFLDQIWCSIKWTLVGLSVFFVLFANIKFIKNFEKGFVKTFCKVSFFSLTFISALSPVPFNFWHLYLIYPTHFSIFHNM